MKKYFYAPNVLLCEDQYGRIAETWKATDDLEIKIPEGTRVLLTHKHFGHVTIENVTEVHFNYPTYSKSERVAIESDIDRNGANYDLENIIVLWFNA